MTATPDPRLVRDIVRSAVGYVPRDSVRDRLIQCAMAEHGIDEHDVPTWSAYYDAVLEAMDTVRPKGVWPDEELPQPADPDTPAGRIDAWLTAWKRYYGALGVPFGTGLIAGPPPAAEPRASADDFGVVLETLAAVMIDRARFQAKEHAQDECDADVRAVAAVFGWLKKDRDSGLLWVGPVTSSALTQLEDRFAERIAELEACTANGGAQ